MTESEAWRAIEANRHVRPTDREWLWSWIHTNTGVAVSHNAVCKGHSAPLDMIARQVIERPRLALWHGPRGSGKSFMSAIDTHITSRFHPRHETRILGGSLAQSEQVYRAITEAIIDGRGPHGHSDRDTIETYLKTSATYRNGSSVSILACSAKSVRGPHLPTLKLDEVDEIDPEHRQSAMGMVMEKHGCRASVLMTSTWHRVGGPMAEMIDRGRSGKFPVDTYCVFEVLETCPEERSGPALGGGRFANCDECPLQPWCHADLGEHPSGLPKAKRSSGHYKIDSLIQKVESVSPRVFESDYLCMEPRAAGAWFTEFDRNLHVKLSAEYDRNLPVHVAVDPGVETGGVWFQVRRDMGGRVLHVNVFGDHYAYNIGAGANAQAVRKRTTELTGLDIRQCRYSMDSAAKAKTANGPIVLGEYQQAACVGKGGSIETWPDASKADQLALLEMLVKAADGKIRLTIHPRCEKLIDAMAGYERAKHGTQWLDRPKDPQHPHEDMVDPLCGGLKLEFPEGRTPQPNLHRMPARSIF